VLFIYPPVKIKEASPRSPRYLSEQERIRIADLRAARCRFAGSRWSSAAHRRRSVASSVATAEPTAGTDRSVAHPQRMLDAALRPQAFPPEAGSPLPGLLAATRTGLPRQATTSFEIAISIYPSPSNSLGAHPIVVELRDDGPGVMVRR